MTEKVSIAIIGGSGLYHMSGLQDAKEHMMWIRRLENQAHRL